MSRPSVGLSERCALLGANFLFSPHILPISSKFDSMRASVASADFLSAINQSRYCLSINSRREFDFALRASCRARQKMQRSQYGAFVLVSAVRERQLFCYSESVCQFYVRCLTTNVMYAIVVGWTLAMAILGLLVFSLFGSKLVDALKRRATG